MAPMAASLIVPMASSLIQPVASSLTNALSGKGQEGRFLPLLAFPLMIKVLGKKSEEQEKDTITWVKIISSAPSFNQYRDY